MFSYENEFIVDAIRGKGIHICVAQTRTLFVLCVFVIVAVITGVPLCMYVCCWVKWIEL